MQFRILGPLEVDDGGHLLDLGRPKQRALLALLLVHANSVVSVDKLVDDLWAGNPPDDASAALQVQVSRLRRVLAAGGRGATVESRRPGYALRVAPGELDAERFQSLVAEACRQVPDRSPARALELLDEALALWRGPALAEFADQPFAMAEAVRLEELRLAAQEERVEAELALGRHGTLVGPLRLLAGEHPLRERLWGQLMVALYRCGRQAEALRIYGELRGHLADQLGIDPSPALQHLEEAVLLQSPELDWAPPPAAPPEPQAATTIPFPGPSAARALPFVGREQHLKALHADWDRALGEGPRLVLLGGEPGVGKTRLALELASVAAAEGARVLVGHCDEELAVPYQPFAEALARVLPDLPPAERDACVAGRSAELRRLVPELAALTVEPTAPVASDPETERYRLFEAVVRTLAALSRTTPVVFVLDDLQWAAKPTLLLLRHLVTRAEPMPLLALGTYRDTEHAALDPVGELGVGDRVSRLPLTGLAEDAVGELVAVATGRALAGDEEVDLVRAIHAGTAGNPFFVGEVVRDISDAGAALPDWSTHGGDVPEGVRTVVHRRLARLSEVTNRLLTVAAVIGGHYHLHVLQAAAAVDEDTALAGLEEAISAGLVVEVAGSPLRQRFTHALVRAALYDDLSAARRAQLHRRVGEALEQVFAGRLADHLPELAHHFVQAAALGGAARAVRYSTLAGDRALELLAQDEAADHYQQALELLPAAAAPDEDGRRCDLLLALGEAQKRCGAPASRRTLLDAARLADRLGDAQRLARAAVANSRGFWSTTTTVDGEKVAVLEAALNALPAEDSELRARVLATLAVELVYTGDAEGVRRRSDEALAVARRLGDLPTLAAVLIPRYNTLRGDPGTLAERLANTAELLAVTDQLPDPSLRCQGWGWRAIAAMEAADAPEAGRCFAVFDRLSAELRQPTALWFTTYLRAGRMLLAGHFDEAERLSTEAFRLGRSAGHADAELFLSCQRIQLAFERGGLDRWERPLRVALNRHPESRWFLRTWQALAYCELDRDADARPIFDELAAKDFADFSFEPTWLYVVANCVAVCAQLGDAEKTATLLELLRPYDGQFVTMSSLAYSGAVAHYLGMLAATLGRFDEAVAYFESAAATHEHMGAPTWLARTRMEWAGCLLAAGAHRDEAVALLDQAVATASDLGMAVVGRRAAALRGRRTRQEPPGPATQATPRPR